MKIEINLGRSTNLKNNDSLYDVYVLDYGDNYHRLDNEPSSEFEKSVRNIRARYKSLSSYNDAIWLYREWMEYLAEKHGGKDILKKKIKAELVTDFIPRKPRLKNNPLLKSYYKHGIILSEPEKFIIDMDKVNELSKLYHEELDQVTVTTKRIKEAENLMDSYYGGGTVKHTIRSHAFESDEEFLSGYFGGRRTKIKKSSKKKKKKEKREKFLLSDVLAGCYDYDESDIEDSDDKRLMDWNGLALTNGTTKEMAVYRKLNEIGWISYKFMKRANYGKRLTKMFKPQKKGKKKKKKSAYDGLVIDLAQEAGYDTFEDFTNAMLNQNLDDELADQGIILRDKFR